MQSDLPSKLIPWRVFCREAEGRKVMLDRSLRRGTQIYHMLIWPHAKAIFEDGRLRLSSVRSWKDPYEKWWCDILFRSPSKLAGIQAYGQCWTTSQFDEPLWRMAGFGKNEPIVRIRCRANAILDAGLGLIGISPGSLFLGRVSYQRESKLVRLADSVISRTRKEVTRTSADMLLQKRTAFRFEKEVRLLWLNKQAPQPAAFIEIDPVSTITQVMISPYATLDDCREIRAYGKKHGIEVKRSALMRMPASR